RIVTMGRSRQAEMPLLDDAASRRHARLWIDGGTLYIEDLESRNGTLVNGERIDKVALRPGDCIAVGATLIQVLGAGDRGARVTWDFRRVTHPKMRSRMPERVSGSLREIPLSELLQMLERSRRNRTIVVRSGHATGRIHLRAGQPIYAS